MKSLLKKLFKPYGVSLVELLSAVGIAGGVGLLVAKLNKDTLSVSNTSQVNSEINYFLSETSYILSNKENCNATIGVTPGSGVPVGGSVVSIRKIVRGVQIEQFNLSTPYGQNSFQINSMRTEAAPNGINLVIDISRTNRNIQGANRIVKRIPLKAVFSGGNITSCFSDNESIVEQAARAACQGNSVVWDDVNKECHHDINQVICDPGQILQRIRSPDGIIQSECVPVIKNPIVCPTGQYFKSITTEGVVTCAPISLSNNCGNNQYIRALSNGQAVCENIPICSNGQYLKANSAGALSCTSFGCNVTTEYFAGFNTNGTSNCKPFPVPTACTGNGQYIKEIAPNGTPVCGTSPNHQALPQNNFSFVDGFSGSWSRKTMDQTAQAICARFGARSWSGNKCNPTFIITPTPINGGWSSWSSWSLCDGFTRTRTRTCTNPAPANGGAPCSGASSETAICSVTPITTGGGGGCQCPDPSIIGSGCPVPNPNNCPGGCGYGTCSGGGTGGYSHSTCLDCNLNGGAGGGGGIVY